MIKMSSLATALLLAFATAAHAETTTQASPASTGAARVASNDTANKSGGKADKGLDTAEKNVTAQHGKKVDHAYGKEEKAERVARTDRVERLARPDRPERPSR